MTKKNCMICMRNGDFFMSQIDTEAEPPETIARRMTNKNSPGYMILVDGLWGKAREIILNMGDVSSVVIEEVK